MALPILAGVPWLAGAIGYFFTKVFSFFLGHYTKRIAIVLAAVAVIATITIAFIAAVSALLSGLAIAMPSAVSTGIAMLVPYNADDCIGVILSAHALRYAYSWQVRIIQYKLF